MNLDPSAFVADQALIQMLEPHASAVPCDEDRTLFNQGDKPEGVYIFHSGDVRLTMATPLGEVAMNMPAANGSLLGLPGMIGNVGYSLSAFAKRGARVSFIDREEFSHIMLTEPGASMMILRVLAAEVRTARMALAEM